MSRPLVGLDAITLHETARGKHFYITVGKNPFVFLVPVQGIGLQTLALYDIADNDIPESLPGLPFLLRIDMTGLLRIDFRFQKPFFIINEHIETVRKNFVGNSVLHIPFHFPGLYPQLHHTVFGLYVENAFDYLHRSLVEVDFFRFAQFAFARI